jgi:signal transduction histidine kinase
MWPFCLRKDTAPQPCVIIQDTEFNRMMPYLNINLFAFMPIIFLVYGLTFFMLGITISVENFLSGPSGPSVRFKRFIDSPWGALAVFGLLQGLYEFMETFSILYGGLTLPLKVLRLPVLLLSFYFLFKFGVSYGRNREKGGAGSAGRRLIFPNIMIALWLVLCLYLLIGHGFGDKWLTEAGILSRYLLGLPGGLVAAFALAMSKRDNVPGARKYLMAASLGFGLYAAGLLITSKADFFSLPVPDYGSFYRAVHVPVQVFRTVIMVIVTFALLRFFRLSKDFASIRFKAIMHVIIAVVIPAFCIILLVSYLMADALLRLSHKENERLASATAHRMEVSLINTEKAFKYNMLFARTDRDVPVKDFIEPLLGEDSYMNGVAFFDAGGEIFRAVSDPSSQAVSFSGDAGGLRTRNLLAALTPETALSDFYVLRHGGRNASMVFPLKGGRIEVFLDLERLYESVENGIVDKDWRVLLADDRGGVVLGGIQSAREDMESGKLYDAIEEKIGPTGWALIMEIPRDDVVAPVLDVFKGLVAGILLVYLSAVAAAVFSVGKVTRPINAIAERVKSIGRGDFASTAGIKTGDEVQTLSDEVEKMAVMLVEKKEMEKRLVQTQKIASLGRLVSGVAHEINNPLSVIIWSSQLLLREFKPGDRRHEDLKMLEKHALACKKIVDDLLRFSRTGKQVDIAVDINRNIEEALSLIGKHTKGDISLVLDFDPSSPKVQGDPDRLHQVFLNLAVNAVDAMKKEGGTLTVSTRSAGAARERSVEVTFADTGCGISPEDMERIFDPFFTTKEAGEGTGLGLSVSYGIVSDHNGRMWAESAGGKGSTFHIVLPELENAGQETT